ncbi:MAG TPA: hypothetical protein VFV55_06905 [Usitatibacteraceae bacterium]|nr:hypothetical protein [Usitatibacteraceae bacterium]
MRIPTPFEIDRRAHELRREELSKLLDDAACAVRKALARFLHRSAPVCHPRTRLAA